MKSAVVRGALTALLLGIAVAVVVPAIFRPPELPALRTTAGSSRSADPVPWREPEADMRRFFPGADAHREEIRILSAERLTLIRRLGRQPTAEEHLAVLHRVFRRGQRAGVVLVRRVRGSGGSIEVVLAVDSGGKICGIRLQRHREPKEVAAVLDSDRWLSAFVGRRADSDWSVEQGPLAAAMPAREPAQAIAHAVRSALIVLETAETRGIPAAPPLHH